MNKKPKTTEVVTTETPGEQTGETKRRAVWLPINSVQKWAKNPRTISAKNFEELKASITDDPEFSQSRPLLVNDHKGEMTVYAGNMRLSAMKALGWPAVPCIVEKDLPKAVMRKRALRDNAMYGQWDFEMVANEFSEQELEEMHLPEKEMWLFHVDKDGNPEDMDLPTGNKNPFQQMTFTVANMQAIEIQEAIADIIRTQEYEYMVTHGNQNSNGNALALIIEQWRQMWSK